jgi:hypothetical protein
MSITGTSVLSGMVGVTCFGLLLTPVFYVVIRWCVERRRETPEPSSNHVGMVVTIALVPCLLGLLSGCMLVGPDYKTPLLQAFAGFANQAQAGLSTETVETAWWRGFQDDRLNQVVELALAHNHDVRVATARIREARALLSETTFDRYPTVTAQGSYTRERVSQAQTFPGADRDLELSDVGFDASWELDFFGRVRRSIEASAADVGAAEAHFRDAMVSLLAEVARNYFVLRGTQHRLAVARQNAANQQHTLDLTVAQLGSEPRRRARYVDIRFPGETLSAIIICGHDLIGRLEEVAAATWRRVPPRLRWRSPPRTSWPSRRSHLAAPVRKASDHERSHV